MNLELQLREFTRADNVEYSLWFADRSMNRYLGPAWSSEELDQILKNEAGSVLSVFHSSELIGVVSMALPNSEHKRYGVTGVAVKPQKQRQGFGAKILLALQKYYKTPHGQEWMGFVNVGNDLAQQFMEKQGWEKGDIENEMYRYMYIQRA